MRHIWTATTGTGRGVYAASVPLCLGANDASNAPRSWTVKRRERRAPFMVVVSSNAHDVFERHYLLAIRNGMGESQARNTRARANQPVLSVERSLWLMQKK